MLYPDSNTISEGSLAEPTTSLPKLYLGEIKVREMGILWT